MSSSPAAATPRPAWGNVLLCSVLGLVILGLMLLHRREWEWHDPGARRWAYAAVAGAAWLGFTLALRRWQRRALRAQAVAVPDAGGAAVAPILVAFASQTGTAAQWAQQTADSLGQAGAPVRLIELGQLDLPTLAAADRVLFVVSTTGEGDAPDSAARFVTQCMRALTSLGSLHYGLLAVGDRDYEDFCGFGRNLRHWLQQSGATPLFDAVEVDNGDAAALRHWQHHLALLSGASELPDWQAPDYQRWTLVERRQLNPGTVGGACFHLALRPADGGALAWQAGDLVEIGPRHADDAVTRWLARYGFDGDLVIARGERRASLRAWLAESHLPDDYAVRAWSADALVAALQALPHREYSIASLPADGALHLLVRRMQREDGTPGIGSGWLTQHVLPGEDVALRIRANPGFHAPADDRPLLLIGNGTGLSSLRALLKARIAAGRTRNWLLFGERQAQHDFYYRDEIEAWLRAEQLARLDLAWSRDGETRVYVQDRLREQAERLRAWVAEGASIYVCGSLDGMAPGVDAVLREVLGESALEQLRESGRYRRDVY